MYIFNTLINYASNEIEIILKVIAIILILILFIIIFLFSDKKWVKNLAFIAIFFLTILSKSGWCYLGLIIYIAYYAKILNEDLIDILRKIFHNRSKDVQLEQIEKEYIKSKNLNNPKYAEKNITEHIINWFKFNKNIVFKNNVKTILPSGKVIYADAISHLKDKDIILEIKYLSNLSDLVSNNLLNKYFSYLETYNNKSVFNLYFVFICDENLNIEEFKHKNIELFKMEFIQLFFFKFDGENLALIKPFTEYLN